VAAPVGLGGVDKVNPEFNSAFHRTLAIRIADVAAPGFPARLPHPESDLGDLRTAATQGNVFHASPAPRTRRKAKNLSRREVEPFRRTVGEAEPQERLVVLFVQ